MTPPRDLRSMVSLALALGAIACGGKGDSRDDAPAPRIVSLAPALTEIVKALGAEAHLVGVTAYCAAPGVPVVGDFAPRHEAVMAQRPDVVLMAGYQTQAPTAAALTALGLKVESLPLVDLVQMSAATRTIGRLVQREARADEVIRRLEQVLHEHQPAPGAPTVEALLVYDVQPGFVITTGGGDHVIGLLQHLGVVNLRRDGPVTVRLGLEEVLREDPDLILHVAPDPRFPDSAAALRHWSAWPELGAVRRRQVYVYPDDGLARNGPHLAEVVPKLAAWCRAARDALKTDPERGR